MSWWPLGLNLVVTLGVVALLMVGTFAVALRSGVHAVVDTVWGLGFVVVAAVSAGLSAGHGDTTRRLVVLGATAAWGLRLAGYLHVRNHGHGEDPRYASMLRRAPGNPAAFAFRIIYWTQGRIMWVVSLPVQVAMYERAPAGATTWVGVGLWAVGLGFEAVGDAQLRRFRADPANAGRLLDRGLWRYTRHPNYFGDAVVWWGLFVMACGSWAGLATVVSPVAMTYLLVAKSGKALLERRMARSRGPEYAEYVARTSGFVPRPPRRSVPTVDPG